MDVKPSIAPAEVRLKRFLHYGSEAPVCGDRFYLQPFQLDKLTAIEEMLANCAPDKQGDAVNHILKALMDGYSAYPECLIFALAACVCQKSSVSLRAQAYNAVSKVCKTSKDLFLFTSFTKILAAPTSGCGSGWRKALSDWYLSKEPLDLAKCVTQNIGAHGYTHKDLFRLVHLKTDDKAKLAILVYVMKGMEAAKMCADPESPEVQKVLSYLQVVHDVKHETDAQTCSRLLECHNLTKEFVPSPLYKSADVWIALVPRMPIRDLLDSLVRLSCNGLLKAGNPLEAHVVDRLSDQTAIVESNLHPTEVYCALALYENHARNTHEFMEKLHKQGKRDKEAKPAPKPNAKILAVLKKLLISSFKLLVPTGMRYLVALDLSSNMQTWKSNGARDIKPAHAATLLALCLLHADREVTVVGFPSLPGAPPEEELIDRTGNAPVHGYLRGSKRKAGETVHPRKTELRPMIPLSLDKELSVEDNTTNILETLCGPVEVCQPIVWAQENQKPVDVFIVLTDYVTMRKREFKEPAVALQEYRQKMNLPNSKLITCALVANTLDVAVTNDVGMLDIVGFNGKIARIIEAFSRGAF